MNRILVPIDFSERSTAAAKHAVALAQKFDSELTFAHVLISAHAELAAFDGAVYAVAPVDEESMAERTAELDRFVQRVCGGRAVEKIVLAGDPARKIAELAKDRAFDLIVMPTHGYGPFRRFVLGSVTAKVLHDVECPVFTGIHLADVPAGDPQPYQRVACAVDLREHSEKVLRWAAEFAAAYRAGLVVIHAAPSLDVSGRGGPYVVPEWGDMLIQSARRQVERLIQKAGCQAEIYVDTAEVTKCVPLAITQAGANLLVVGRSAHNGLIGRLRTNAYALIRESPCPVISV